MNLTLLDADTLDRGDVSFEALEALGSLTCHPRTAPDETATRLSSTEIAITNKVVIDAAVMDACPGLKMIQVAATGVNNVDIPAAKERGIRVGNVSGYSTPSVAQHTFTLILNLVTQIHVYANEAAAWARSPIFTRLDHPITELAGTTLGIVGLGTIGRAVARIGDALDMRVVALAREGATSASTGSSDRPRLPLETFLAESDVLSLHCPLTPETEHFINERTLQAMKETALLINTGRGALVDEEALVAALRGGVIGGAGLDVLSAEPPPTDHPLLAPDLPNLIITPHSAWASREARRRLLASVAENIRAFQAGETLPNPVA